MTEAFSERGRVSRVPGVLWTQLEGQGVLLNIATSRYYQANQVGRVIWESLETPRRIADVVARVVARYRVDSDQCRRDVLDFLTKLHAAGLVVLENDPNDSTVVA
jgi:hypothetical protein